MPFLASFRRFSRILDSRPQLRRTLAAVHSLQDDAAKLTCGGEHLTVGTEAAVENPRFVRRDLDIAYQGWVAPDAQGVIWEAAGADNLLVVVAPAEACHLRAGVDAVSASSGGGVPEMDVSIIRSAPSGQ